MSDGATKDEDVLRAKREARERRQELETLQRRALGLGHEILNRQDELAEVGRQIADLQKTLEST